MDQLIGKKPSVETKEDDLDDTFVVNDSIEINVNSFPTHLQEETQVPNKLLNPLKSTNFVAVFENDVKVECKPRKSIVENFDPLTGSANVTFSDR